MLKFSGIFLFIQCYIYSHVWNLGTVYAKDISDFGTIYVQYLDPVKFIALTVDSLPITLECFLTV
jgi:hypothetical protein